MQDFTTLRTVINEAHLTDQRQVLSRLIAEAEVSAVQRQLIQDRAIELVEDIRRAAKPGLMEVFLAEYGLSTQEGVALMCLAEALLRVPDQTTIDDLIEDKIAASAWSDHLGQSSSPLVNASTWALMLTGSVLNEESQGVVKTLRGAVKRLGEPVIRTAVTQAMKELGRQFVLGRTIAEAVKNGGSQEKKGFTYSYDMLGEAALTAKEADDFFRAYAGAISALAGQCTSKDIRENPGISVKLSALHPRYEFAQKDRVMAELVPLVKALAVMAKKARMGFNIDAEEADRLDISLDVIEAVLRDPAFKGWDGFGVVVQAYGKRASHVLDWLHALATDLNRKIMVRLVKGAYWDTEIKLAQVGGLSDFPVFTHKAATDVSYICCAKKLLGMTDRIYPQFATHNAHTVAAILEMATDKQAFEFQRLHGMGEALHQTVLSKNNTRCRIYAPVGAHRDLLAYLVRRLLENGANSSFVNQIVDTSVPAADVAADPFNALDATLKKDTQHIRVPADIFAPERKNSQGWNLRDLTDVEKFDAARGPFERYQWHVTPNIVGVYEGGEPVSIINPANPDDIVGAVVEATANDVELALAGASDWQDCAPSERAEILRRASDLYEQHHGVFFAALTREAGKTPLDAVGELREAVDFLRYYAARAEELEPHAPRGIFGCISPWNFPLAIFTGQIAGALATGNGVLAKPAETTPIVASIAVWLLHEAGVPKSVLQLLPGRGGIVGAKISSDPRIDGICFTGSTATAQTINKAMAANLAPEAPLLAETGGLNAMIVDSTALPQQAVRDIVASAFQSAGQRCSALRLLYVQEDVAPAFLEMLYGTMDELSVGDPWRFETDLGPVISETARAEISGYVAAAEKDGRLLKQLETPAWGSFVAPAVIKVGGIADLEKEVFGPVLHVATFRANEIDRLIGDINASGYGLTFGLHTRIDDRVEHITSNLHVGNMYINRNQIGAVVGSQPFGGEGMSGTGPKAGGPLYLRKFIKAATPSHAVEANAVLDVANVQAAIDKLKKSDNACLSRHELPGPTGESNRLSVYARGVVLCLGPTAQDAAAQAELASQAGCPTLIIAPGAKGANAIDGQLSLADLKMLKGFDAVALWSTPEHARAARVALAERTGPLIPLMMGKDIADQCVLERHVCIDTTAAGGNASLLAAVA